MTALEVTLATDTEEREGYGAPTVVAEGSVTSRPISPGEWPLWGLRATLSPGATLRWGADHGDEAIYVLEGALEYAGKQCPAEGSVIIEAGVEAVVTAAGDGETRIVHFGPTDTTPPNGKPGETVHMIGPRGMWSSQGDKRDTRIYADSHCDTCKTTIFYTARMEEYNSAGHSHSQDELIHLLWGEINVGRRKLTAGDTIAIPKDLRYGFRSGAEGFGFLNYRPDASVQSFERGGEPRIEGGAANGMDHVADVIH